MIARYCLSGNSIISPDIRQVLGLPHWTCWEDPFIIHKGGGRYGLRWICGLEGLSGVQPKSNSRQLVLACLNWFEGDVGFARPTPLALTYSQGLAERVRFELESGHAFRR